MMIIKAFTNQNTIFYIIAINIIYKFNFNFIHQDQVKFQFFKLSSELEFFQVQMKSSHLGWCRMRWVYRLVGIKVEREERFIAIFGRPNAKEKFNEGFRESLKIWSWQATSLSIRNISRPQYLISLSPAPTWILFKWAIDIIFLAVKIFSEILILWGLISSNPNFEEKVE